MCITDHCNDAEVTTGMLQISVRYLCRNTKCRVDFRVIWKDLSWTADSYRLLKYRGRYTIALFQISLWCENAVAARLYAVICKQLLISNNRNIVRWVVLGLPQDGACTDLFENLSEISLKGDLSNATTFNPHLFSLVNTFNKDCLWITLKINNTKLNKCKSDIWLVLAIKTITPMGSNVLLLHAKTSRKTFATGINLLRKHVSKKFSIIFPFEKGENACNYDSADIAAKTTTSCEFEEG